MAITPKYMIPMTLNWGIKELSELTDKMDEKDEKKKEEKKEIRNFILEDISGRLNELFKELSTDEIHEIQIYLANFRAKIVNARESLSKLAIGNSPSNDEETFIGRVLHDYQDSISKKIIIFNVAEELIDFANQISITVLQEKKGLNNKDDTIQLLMKMNQESQIESNVTG